MKRIDTSTRAIDLFGVGKDGYKDGNKGAGIPATDLNASVLNAMQEEISNVIEGVGAALNSADNTQLLAAIKIIVQNYGNDYIAKFTTTANINLTGLGTQAGGDWGGALTAGDVIFVKNQTTGSQNGWYSAAAGAWSRVTWADASAEIKPGALTMVSNGATLTDSIWILTTDAPIILATTALMFARKDVTPVNNGIQGSFRSLKGSAPGTSAVVTFTADEIITGDGVGNYLTTRNWNNTITMTSAGAGGLDAGAVAASTWYFAFAITKDDGTQAFMASLSATAPTMPSGYTKLARIGAFRTDSSGNKYPLAFVQYGRKVQYKIAAGTNVTGLPIMASGTTAQVAVGVGNFVPQTAASIDVVLSGVYAGNGAGVGPSSTYIPSAGFTAYPIVLSAQTTATTLSVSGSILLESTNIYWYASGGSNLSCFGWEDNI